MKYFKIVPVEVGAEIPTGEPCLMIWDAGHPTFPNFTKGDHVDFARHIMEGSAVLLNVDKLIREQKEVS